MGIYYNTAAVMEDVLCIFDASNPKCYSGTGNIWSDALGRFSMTLAGTYTYNQNSAQSYFKFNPGTATLSNSFAEGIYIEEYAYGMSMELWYRSNASDTFSAYGRIVDMGDTSITLGSSSSYRLRCWVDKLASGLTTYDRTSEVFKDGIGQDGIWHHLVLAYAPNGTSAGVSVDGTLKLYIDGVLESSVTGTNYGKVNGGTQNGYDIVLGTGDGNDFRGDIAMFKMYGRALHLEEVNRNYRASRDRFK